MADSRMIFASTGITQGRMFWRGAWSSIVQYRINDIVSSGGNSYIAIADSLNVAPTVTTSWNLMASGNAVTSVAGRVGAITLSSADLGDKDAANGVAGLDASGFLKASEATINANTQTGTTYTIVAGDRGKLVTLSNAASVAVTVPQATGSFAAGFFCEITSLGAGTCTLTPTTSTIDGAASITLKQFQSITLTSVGGNWISLRNYPGGSTGSGAVVLATSPTFVTSAITPVLVLNGNTLNGVTGSGTAVVTNTSPTIATPTLTGTAATGNIVLNGAATGTGAALTVGGTSSTTGGISVFVGPSGGQNERLAIVPADGSTAAVRVGALSVRPLAAGFLTGTEVAGISTTGAISGLSIALGGGTALTTTNRTGTGNLVLATSPTITTPTFSGGVTGMTLGVTRFTASGTFTIPTGVTSVRVRAVGGGGAGGGTSGAASINGVGGSSGGYGEKILTGLTPGNTLTITIGGGGAGVSNGTGGTGGNTTVASGTQTITSIVANGGNGGLVNGQPLAGASAGSGGDSNFGGSPGQTGFGINVGGNGAGAVFAGGGTAGLQGAGNAAGAPGSGGGGAGGNAGSASAGGAGAAGIVIFEYVT